MRPMATALVIAALTALLGGVPELISAGNPPMFTAPQWDRAQQQQQLIRTRFNKLLQQARAQQRLIMAWQKKERMQAKHKSQVESKAPRQSISMAASR